MTGEEIHRVFEAISHASIKPEAKREDTPLYTWADLTREEQAGYDGLARVLDERVRLLTVYAEKLAKLNRLQAIAGELSSHVDGFPATVPPGLITEAEEIIRGLHG